MLLRAAACNFTEYNTPTFLKMYKQYQIPQNITYTFWKVHIAYNSNAKNAHF